jgi:hypothetical protein
MRRRILLASLLGLAAGPAFAQDAKEGGGRPEDDPGAEIFLPRMLVAAIQGNEVKRHYALLIKLRIADKKDVELVRASMDRLQNAYVYDLNDVAARGNSFDRERAKRRMLASSARILGKEGIIEDVIFERVLERRIGS